VFVAGGSQGAAAINRAIQDALGHLKELSGSIRFVHQAGDKQVDEVREAYRSGGFDAEVASFFPDIAREYAEADLVGCRAGATTVAEIRAAGRPALFIPFEFAADDHQRKNARAMVERQAAVMIDPSELSGERLGGEIIRLMGDPELRDALGRNAHAMAVLDAESGIVDLIEEIAIS